MMGLMIALVIIAIAWNCYRPYSSLLLYATVTAIICVIILYRRNDDDFEA